MFETIQIMRYKTSLKIDNMSVHLLKYYRDAMTETLVHFIELSVQLDQFPDCLTQSNK